MEVTLNRWYIAFGFGVILGGAILAADGLLTMIEERTGFNLPGVGK